MRFCKQEEPKSKTEKNEDIESEIRVQLEEKHGDKYTGQKSFEMEAIRATMNHYRYLSSLVSREGVFSPKKIHFLML